MKAKRVKQIIRQLQKASEKGKKDKDDKFEGVEGLIVTLATKEGRMANITIVDDDHPKYLYYVRDGKLFAVRHELVDSIEVQDVVSSENENEIPEPPTKEETEDESEED